MSDQDSIVVDQPVDQPVEQPSANPYESLLAQVADGKYRSIEDALRSVDHAQKHISTLEAELARLNDELATKKAAEEILEEIKTKPVVKETQPSVPAEVPNKAPDLSEIVRAELERMKVQESVAKNIEVVKEKLSSTFGDKAAEVYKTKAEELGVSVNFLDDIAKKSPKALFDLLGMEKAKSDFPQKNLQSSIINDPSLQPKESKPDVIARFRGGSSSAIAKWKKAGESLS